jgi:hypothetical protein
VRYHEGQAYQAIFDALVLQCSVSGDERQQKGGERFAGPHRDLDSAEEAFR